MTFNQWFAGKRINRPATKLALEKIWNELIGAGHSPNAVGAMLRDLLDEVRERAA